MSVSMCVSTAIFSTGWSVPVIEREGVAER